MKSQIAVPNSRASGIDLSGPSQTGRSPAVEPPDSQAGGIETARVVRVWFGRHVLAELHAAPARAAEFEAAMGRRFAGLRITNTPDDHKDFTGHQAG